jgi:hypothetical protein
LLQRRGLRSRGETTIDRPARARGRLATEVGEVTPKAPSPVSATVARFVDRLAKLSPEDWQAIQITIGGVGLEHSMLELSRNAAVALAVRDLISREQFDDLYRPFNLAIPVDSLEAPPELD